MENSFYVTLPSNVFSYENNKISDYTTYLPKPLHLTDDYHVALTEISYTKSWYNVQRMSEFHVHDPRFIINGITGISPGWYKSINDLINVINNRINNLQELHELKRRPKLILNEHGQTVSMELGLIDHEIPVNLRLGDELEEMLGLSTSERINQNEIVKIDSLLDVDSIQNNQRCAVRPFDMKAGIHSLMIYSDIVSYSIVGNAQANFLRSAHVDDKYEFGSDVSLIFRKPYYLPVNSNYIDKIRINIKDDSGNPIQFQFGRVSVTLHFKRTWKAII